MLKWLDVVKFATKGNPVPDRRVEKTPEEYTDCYECTNGYQLMQNATNTRILTNGMPQMLVVPRVVGAMRRLKLYDEPNRGKDGPIVVFQYFRNCV